MHPRLRKGVISLECVEVVKLLLMLSEVTQRLLLPLYTEWSGVSFILQGCFTFSGNLENGKSRGFNLTWKC